LSLEYLARLKNPLPKQVYAVPEKIDQQIAREKLAAMQVRIDSLTPEQKKYLASWDLGT
jgi:adenosylhomocysteinase